jgi:hypothetical protein
MKVVSFADVARTMRLTQRALALVEQRVADLSRPIPDEGGLAQPDQRDGDR